MSRRDSTRGPNPDDWFTPPGGARSRGSGPATGDTRADEGSQDEGAADDWLSDEGTAGHAVRAARRELGRRGVAIGVGAAAILVLIVGLAIGGVFSGGGSSAPPTTAATTTTPAPTTTPSPLPTPVAPPAPATTLKPGDTGAQVKVLQRALTLLGYPTGKVDGDYGPATVSAVMSFQRKSSLAPDGVVGPKTLAALKQALLAHG
jgi:hypothetical protein